MRLRRRIERLEGLLTDQDGGDSRTAVVAVGAPLEAQVAVVGLDKTFADGAVQVALEGFVLHQVKEDVALDVVGGRGASVAVKHPKEAKELTASRVPLELRLWSIAAGRVYHVRACWGRRARADQACEGLASM